MERPAVVPSAPLAAGKAVEAKGFIFKPVKCKRSDGKLICTISFMNNGKEEKKLEVNGTETPCSYLYDNFGNQYPVGLGIGRRKGTYDIKETFVPKLPTNVDFIAEEMRSNATHVTAAIGIEQFKKSVAVRNILISK